MSLTWKFLSFFLVFDDENGLLTDQELVPMMQSGGSQQLVIEGPLSEEYYKLRDLLYSQFYML